MRRLLVAAGALLLMLAVAVGAVMLRPSLASSLFRWSALVAFGAKTGSVAVADGTRIAYAEFGTGRPVLLVHGLGGESVAMLPLARALASRGYRAIAIDLPGSGRSDPPQQELGIDSAGEYALAAAAKLGMGDRPALLGHSLGGWVVAWQALEHPDRCGPLILVASAGVPADLPPLNELMPRTADDARRNQQLLFSAPTRLPGWAYWMIAQRPRPTNVAMLRSAMSGRYLLDGLLEAVGTPTLVVWADGDKVIPPWTGREMASRIPGAESLELRRTGHMLVWERPDELAAAIDDFLIRNQVGRAPGPAGGLHPIDPGVPR